MAINLKSTQDVHTDGATILTYGQSGAGKTTLTATLPSPVILSAEAGLLSLTDADIPYIEIKSLQDLYEAYQWASESEEAGKFKSIALDSISEIGEVVLQYELENNKDGRAAYGELNQSVTKLIRAFRDMKGKNVYFTATMEKTQDEQGRILYGPSMPGKTLTQKLGYFFDFIFAYRIERDSEGKVQRALMTESDGLWLAKSRSDRLDAWESPDLSNIITKIKGE